VQCEVRVDVVHLFPSSQVAAAIKAERLKNEALAKQRAQERAAEESLRIQQEEAARQERERIEEARRLEREAEAAFARHNAEAQRKEQARVELERLRTLKAERDRQMAAESAASIDQAEAERLAAPLYDLVNKLGLERDNSDDGGLTAYDSELAALVEELRKEEEAGLDFSTRARCASVPLASPFMFYV
jgi:hypothetical protein